MGVALAISPIIPLLIAAAIAVSGMSATPSDWAGTLHAGGGHSHAVPNPASLAGSAWHAFAANDGDANHKPVVTVGPDQTVTSGDTVYLTGSATDADGDELEYTWLDATSQGPDYTIANNSTLSASFTAPDVTVPTHIFAALYAFDGQEGGYGVMLITVNPLNYPSVDAGPDQTVDENTLVSLAGRFQNFEGTLAFWWSNNSPLYVEFDNPDLLSIQFIAPSVDSDTELVFTLKVSNGTGTGTITQSDTMTLTVIDSDNTPPEVEAGPDQIVYEGARVTLSGSADDADYDALSYGWSQDPGEPSIQFSDPHSPAPSFTAPAVDSDTTFTLTLEAYDGTDTVRDTLKLTVRTADPGSNPAVEAGPSQIVREGDGVTLAPSVANIEGSVAYEWSQAPMTPPLALGPHSPVTFTAPLVDRDTLFVLTVIASNGTGADGISVSDTLDLTVKDNRAPTADAGRNRNVDDRSAVILSGSGRDPDGDALAYRWVQDSGPFVSLNGDGTANPSFVPPDVDSGSQSPLAFTLTVTDDAADSKSATDAVMITVYNDGEVPPSKSRNSGSSGRLALDLGTLRSSGLVDIPDEITQYVTAFDKDEPLLPASLPAPIDPPMTINESAYLLGGTFNTLEPQAIRAGENTSITFVTHSSHKIASFLIYLNPHGSNPYQTGDTFIQFYDGKVRTVDPHGRILYANITVTSDPDAARKYLVRADVEFADAMEPTSMEIRSWNTQTASTLVRVINAFETLPPQVQTALGAPESDAPDVPVREGALPIEPEPEAPAASPMHALRMWAGFDASVIGDTEVLALLGLDYPGADIPTWVMTQLAPAVIKDRITLDEFMTALVFVLGNS